MSAVLKLKPRAVEATLETITPAKAKQYLETMVTNRALSQNKICDYAMAIYEDRFPVNGETIKFDAEGRLFDGQHRLHACILADKPFQALVVRGISDPRAMSTVDTGKTRSHTDVWTINGQNNAALASTIAYIIYLQQHNRVTWSGFTGRRIARSSVIGRRLAGDTPTLYVSKDELLQFAQPIMDGIQDAARVVGSAKARKIISPQALGALYYYAAKKDAEAAQRFLDDLSEGAGMEVGDPALTVREQIIARTHSGGKLHRAYQFGLLIKAWNARREGKKLRVIRVLEGEEFPRVK